MLGDASLAAMLKVQDYGRNSICRARSAVEVDHHYRSDDRFENYCFTVEFQYFRLTFGVVTQAGSDQTKSILIPRRKHYEPLILCKHQ